MSCDVTHSKVPKIRTGAFLRNKVLPTGAQLSELVTGKGVSRFAKDDNSVVLYAVRTYACELKGK